MLRLWLILVLVLVVNSSMDMMLKEQGRRVPMPESNPFRGKVENQLYYVYIVGVEGVGHHGVSPAIATIARTCGMHALFELKLLSLYRQERSSRGFKNQVEKLGSTRYPSRDVVIIEDSSFPDAKILRNATLQQIRLSGHYDIAWAHNEMLTNNPDVRVKYLYLNRDFYRTVASHPEFDGGFQRHAQVLHQFVGHIRSEYTKINNKQPDIWRQISYEWFTNMHTHNCTAIVSSVIDYMKWDHCDVEYACSILQKSVQKERKKVADPANLAYAQSFNVTLPIPVLDISPNRAYKFTNVVSKRQPVEISADPDSERIVRSGVSSAQGCSRGTEYTGGRHASLRKQLHCQE